MRAIVFPEKGRVEVWSDLKVAAISENEVQLRTLYSGMSVGTERRWLLGGLAGSVPPVFPFITGYQNVGRIVQVGSKVKGWNIGNIVFSDGGSAPEGWKGGCSGGHVEICNRTPEGNFVRLPAGLDPQEACLLGVMAVGMRAAKRGGVRLSDRVLVIGLGLVGQACAQVANAMGAEVHGVDIAPFRLELAERFSCHRVWNGNQGDTWNEIRRSGPFDVVFETSGARDVPDLGLSCIRNSTGRMVAVAVRSTMVYRNSESGHAHESTIIHTNHFGYDDVRDVIRQILNHRVVVGPLITHRIGVDDAPLIYGRMCDDPSDLVGITIGW